MTHTTQSTHRRVLLALHYHSPQSTRLFLYSARTNTELIIAMTSASGEKVAVATAPAPTVFGPPLEEDERTTGMDDAAVDAWGFEVGVVVGLVVALAVEAVDDWTPTGRDVPVLLET